MQVITAVQALPAPIMAPGAIVDPLEDDRSDDETVTTTRRAITRIALAATEVAGRFQREGIQHDPMSWLLAPRKLFGGRSAVDACLERDHCLRAVLTHGLGLCLDPTPEALDVLLSEEDDDEFDPDEDFDWGEEDEEDYLWLEPESGSEKKQWRDGELMSPRLVTATICFSDACLMLNAFHASVTTDPNEVIQHLEARYGADVVPMIRLREGYHPSDPLVIALVPVPIGEMILEIQDSFKMNEHGSFSVDLEQRVQL